MVEEGALEMIYGTKKNLSSPVSLPDGAELLGTEIGVFSCPSLIVPNFCATLFDEYFDKFF